MAKKKKKKSEEDEEAKGGPPIKKIAIGAVLGFVIYTKVLSGGGASAAEEETEVTMPEPVAGMIVEAGSIRVSLADTEPHYALVTIKVQLEESADVMAAEAMMPLLLDAAVGELSNFNIEQLKGKTGLEFLKVILLERAKDIFNVEGEQIVVMQIVLTELVVQ